MAIAEQELNTLQVLGKEGHITLHWNPKDKDSVAKAQAEFDRLKSCGYSFFYRNGRATETLPKTADTVEGRNNEVEEEFKRTEELKPEAKETVAVKPQAGG